MAPGHKTLDVCRLATGYAAWVYESTDSLNGVHRPARDQWLRASQSIPLKIAGANGRMEGLIEGVPSTLPVALRSHAPPFIYVVKPTDLKK